MGNKLENAIDRAGDMSWKTWLMLAMLVFVGAVIWYALSPFGQRTGNWIGGKLDSAYTRTKDAIAGDDGAGGSDDPFPGAA